MTRIFTGHRAVILAFVAVAGLITWAVWQASYRQALDQLARQGAADLALAADRLTLRLQLYQQLAVTTVENPVLDGADPAAVAAFLQSRADKTAALDVIWLDRAGRILASANRTEAGPQSDRPWFRRALQGALGEGHGMSYGTGQRAYYFAAPSFDGAGRVDGALAVVADIDRVEAEWRGGAAVVFFTDASGEVFISNRSELLFWQRGAGPGLEPPTGDAGAFHLREIGGHAIWHEEWSPYVPSRALHLSRHLPVIGMTAEALIDIAPARRIAALQAGVVAALMLAFGALLYQTAARRRVLAHANTVLEDRVAERTSALSQTNLALRREIRERHEAEAALKRAQADLVQAGKLSALGQMTAGLSHELNQPLMAIRSFAENGRAFLDKGRAGTAAQNLDRISDMARRMARIIANLRAFARQESEPVGQVDLLAVIRASLELTETRLDRDGIALDWTPPAAPVTVMGGEVRLGQVLVNLITNAADAMTDRAEKRLGLRVVDTGDRVLVEVADTGPGIEEPEKIFDPFYTTKEVGASEGMGLGLSISYGLVQSFGGAIRGRNRPEGGAVFTVELARAGPGQEAAE